MTDTASKPRLAVVAGAGGALGSATTERLRDDGWIVAGVALPRSLERIPQGVIPIPCDLARHEEVARLPEQIDGYGSWQALAICSGGFAMGRAADTDDDNSSAQLEINLLGPWRIARVAVPAMRDAGTGRIVVALSRASVEVASGMAAYQVSKAAAARLVQVMAAELRGDRITVNGVLPGVMDTPANRRDMGASKADRWVPTSRVAGVIAWLCSDEAADVSGALVPVYGRS